MRGSSCEGEEDQVQVTWILKNSSTAFANCELGAMPCLKQRSRETACHSEGSGTYQAAAVRKAPPHTLTQRLKRGGFHVLFGSFYILACLGFAWVGNRWGGSEMSCRENP